MKLSSISKIVILLTAAFALQSQAVAQMQVEKLNRGLVAVRSGSNNILSWRLLANEPYTTGFNIYRGTTRVNSSPITGATFYTDNGAAANSVYTIRAIVNGAEQAASEPALWMSGTRETAGFLDVNLQRPPRGAQGGEYSPNDGSVGDVDGDGVYELFIKWDPSNSKDNAQSGITDNVLIDAYRLDGTRLWRIDLGPNIRAGAHYTQFMVYDFDGDGKAEMMVKTAEGTREGTNSNTPGAFIRMGPAASANHNAVHRNSDGYILTGAEYITVFEGLTGKELATAEYWPLRGNVSSWGDNWGNRVDRFNAAVAYLDGQRPSAVFNRGYYTRLTLAAWDWRGGQLTRRWTFDSNASGNSAYAGQGNHQLSVADVNNSGRHSIITGSAVIGPDGRGMHTSGLGHADALHVAHMIKGHPTPQIFMPHESGSVGVSLRHANNGNMIFTKNNSGDVGRGVAAPFGAAGWFFWSSAENALFNISGTRVGDAPRSNTLTHVETNFLIWWNGDLAREFLIRDRISSWNVANNSDSRHLTAAMETNNSTKRDPVLVADIFGDWREELILRNSNNTSVRIFTTTMPTTHRLVTLMHDPTYRVAVAWQNSSYNQPPHPGYYIAGDMDFPPPVLNVAVIGDEPPPIIPQHPCNRYPGSDACCDFEPNHESCQTVTPPPPQCTPGVDCDGDPCPDGQTGTRPNCSPGDGNPPPPPPPDYVNLPGGVFIDTLRLYDAIPFNQAAWSVQPDLIVPIWAFGDREHTITAIPEYLDGLEWIRTAMNTRTLTTATAYHADTLIRFNMLQDGVVYIAYEDRVTEKPSWLTAQGFAAESGVSLDDDYPVFTVTEAGGAIRTFDIYSKRFSAGETVVLGINENNGLSNAMMYLVAVGPVVPQLSIRAPSLQTTRNAMTITRSGRGAFMVDYAVTRGGNVRLDIYDMRGRRVRTIVNAAHSAGVHRERINTNDLRAGAYLLRLNAGQTVMTERFTVTR